MSGPAFPPVAELIPHAGPMCLLARVVEHEPTRTVCSVVPGRGDLLAERDGHVPVWVGLEYMAQCVAAHAGLISRSAGRAPRPGLLLGSRRLRFDARYFAPDRELRVTARHHHGERGLVAFDCEIRAGTGGSPLVEGRVNINIEDGWHELGSATP